MFNKFISSQKIHQSYVDQVTRAKERLPNSHPGTPKPPWAFWKNASSIVREWIKNHHFRKPPTSIPTLFRRKRVVNNRPHSSPGCPKSPQLKNNLFSILGFINLRHSNFQTTVVEDALTAQAARKNDKHHPPWNLKSHGEFGSFH